MAHRIVKKRHLDYRARRRSHATESIVIKSVALPKRVDNGSHIRARVVFVLSHLKRWVGRANEAIGIVVGKRSHSPCGIRPLRHIADRIISDRSLQTNSSGAPKRRRKPYRPTALVT